MPPDVISGSLNNPDAVVLVGLSAYGDEIGVALTAVCRLIPAAAKEITTQIATTITLLDLIDSTGSGPPDSNAGTRNGMGVAGDGSGC